MRHFFRILVVPLLASIALACGAVQKSAPPSESPASGARSEDSVSKAPPYAQQQPQQYAPPPPTAPTQSPGRMGTTDTPEVRERQRADAWQELQKARGELDATTGDCALACKALASMDRATSHVCTVSPDEAHCGNAKETLKTARRRVRAECMACPNGITVDPDAPIPSAPSAP